MLDPLKGNVTGKVTAALFTSSADPLNTTVPPVIEV
jgi:hypothetical protein